MLTNIPNAVLLIVGIAVPALSAAAVIVLLIRSILHAKKDGENAQLKRDICSLIVLAVAMASWLLNFGWMRLFLTVTAVPFLFGLALFAINHYASRDQNSSKKLAIFSYCVFLLAFFLLPDLADTGISYMLFGLIRNNAVNKCTIFAAIAAVASLLIMIWQVADARNGTSEKQQDAQKDPSDK